MLQFEAGLSVRYEVIVLESEPGFVLFVICLSMLLYTPLRLECLCAVLASIFLTITGSVLFVRTPQVLF